MPPYEKLSIDDSIKKQILDGVSDYYLQEATTFVKVLSDCVKNILNDPKVISANQSTKFYMHTKTWAIPLTDC